MELTDIVYLAFATVAVIVCLHVSVFWVSRLIQPPKPRVVYVERERPAPPPQQQFIPPPPPPPVAPPPPAVQVPTYEQPPIPQPSNPAPRMELPPPIETRQSK